jgi:hypothetical protein
MYTAQHDDTYAQSPSESLMHASKQHKKSPQWNGQYCAAAAAS